MRTRTIAVVTATLAAAAVAAVASVVLFTGDHEVPAAPASTTSTTATTSTTTTTTLPPTTTTTTTTTLPPPRVTLHDDGSSPNLAALAAGLYTWMVDPDAPPLDVPEGLRAHLRRGRIDGSFEADLVVAKAQLASGEKVAVLLAGDDVILAVADGPRWDIVGARLTAFGLEPWYGEPIRHVFVLGTDARPHQSQPDFRADSIHIVAANLDERAGGIVGFPRDSYVKASYGSDKFSSVNVRASTDEMVRIAEDLSGIDLEGYILTGFAGFKHLVNVFGGVEVDVPFRMSDGSSNAFLSAGLQVLRGGDALAFSRNRHITGGDFTRSLHQGMVIEAGLAGAQARGIASLPGLLRMLSEDTWTDLSAAQLLQLGAIAFELEPERVGNVVLPGRVGTANGASVVRLTSGAEGVLADLADGVISDE